MKKFLDKYDTVIFDMDGVITSEQNYWNCAALTVWEYLNRANNIKIDPEECMCKIPEIRSRVFCDDKLIGLLKSKGVNSNWDLGYVTVCIAWICGYLKEPFDDFLPVFEYAKGLSDNIIDEYDELAKKCSDVTGFDFEWLRRNGTMWETMKWIFQEWFLGDELYNKQFGGRPLNSPKSGLLYKEEPIIPMESLKAVLKGLNDAEKRVCTGTGRLLFELMPPLESWGVVEYFSTDGLCNYDHVQEAEKALNSNALTKPHPYMFLKALFGTDYDDEKIVKGEYDASKIKRTLVVGDAGADILAAKAMGADFCAVLTGIQGENARAYFEKMHAEYILGNVAEFLED